MAIMNDEQIQEALNNGCKVMAQISYTGDEVTTIQVKGSNYFMDLTLITSDGVNWYAPGFVIKMWTE